MYLAAIIYLLGFLLLINRNRFFGLFTDETISTKTISWIFLLKCAAVPVFYLVYSRIYGGIEKFDAGIFYHDAQALNNLAWINLREYLKALFGLQDDSAGSYFYNYCIINTQNWDNGKIRDLFYNDNRVVIRVHSILHFFAFKSYYVHALFSCFLSFTGQFFLYKTFKNYFKGKETWFLLIICLVPSLWFYTGAVLKESLVLFVLGVAVFNINCFLKGSGLGWLRALWLILLLFVSVLLKPYLLCTGICFFALMFFIEYKLPGKYQSLVFTCTLLLILITVNFAFRAAAGRSLRDLVLGQQQIFSNASRGGIFLQNEKCLVRLDYDSSLISRDFGTNTFRIRKNVSYMYWEHDHQEDTLKCLHNADTTSKYKLVYQGGEGGSNIPLGKYGKGSLTMAGTAIYYCLFYPFFYNSSGLFQLLASFENLMITLALLIVFMGIIKRDRKMLLPTVFLVFAIFECLVVGITTPNSGAIFRYRSPAIIFIFLSALYYADHLEKLFFWQKKEHRK